jgi:Icc-related predicted phosphoesterase
MKIIHLSDNHGSLPVLSNESNIVIHSGDLLPNMTRGDWSIEPIYQMDILETNRDKIQNWLKGRTFLYCPGNHDFAESSKVVAFLRSIGIDAYDMKDKRVDIEGISFYGFPWCPPITREWNYETSEDDINSRLKEVPQVDVLITHCPPGGIMDGGYGSNAMSLWLSYGVNIPRRAWLFGHMHEYSGVSEVMGIKFSNAATTQNVIEI